MTSIPAGLVGDLWRRGRGNRWGLTTDRFEAVLIASVERGLPAESRDDTKQMTKYLSSLHLEDLALAAACADGLDAAWDYFVREMRPTLYRAADALAPDGGARELADSLYADLFGLKSTGGERFSLFRYFHGRSSLATWLRSVLAQRHVDRIRSERRVVALPDDESESALPAPVRTSQVGREQDVRLIEGALGRAVARLKPDDRLRLACYYGQGLTLAQTGRVLREHEGSTSRHLARIRREIRGMVETDLKEAGLSDAAIGEAFSAVSDDPGPIDVVGLLQPAPRKETAFDRSPEEKTP